MVYIQASLYNNYINFIIYFSNHVCAFCFCLYQDGEDLSNLECTFTYTKHDFCDQHWYHCHTCKMSDGVGCCTICAKVCHKGHDVTYSKFGSFFCDCGAKEDGSCKVFLMFFLLSFQNLSSKN